VQDLFSAEGGIARILRLYMRVVGELGQPGDEVRYVALNDSGDTSTLARRYIGENLAGLENCERSKLAYFLISLLRGAKADRLICGHMHHLILARFAAVINPGLRYYLIAHGIEVWRPYTFLERAALRDAHRIICVSEYTRRQMLRFSPQLDPTRLIVVPNTLDPAFEATGGEEPCTRKERHPRILVVSRLVATDPYKGVDTMIEAMPLILRQFPLAELRIVGGGDDRPRLEQIVQEHGLEGAVHFCGMVDDTALRKEYRTCDIFALPSRKEGFGLVYLEAMSYGKPCLAARAGGAPEVVNKEVGAMAEYGNIDQVAIAISDLVRHPRDAAAIRQWAEGFGVEAFKRRLAAALGEGSAGGDARQQSAGNT
jgi:glycosyltransferase involved in cell wall biosynthesis